MKVAVVGGHLSPALAVIDALPKGTQVIFLGRQSTFEGEKTESLEYKEITLRGIPFFPLTTARIQRSLTRHTLPAFSKLPVGMYQAVTILRKEKPDVIMAFGGYLSIPVGFAARLLRIPVVIHEQTLEAGLANKLLSKFAGKICISWTQSVAYFPKNKIILTGNPIKQFAKTRDSVQVPTGELPLIYITGGSAGSHALNRLIEGALRELTTQYRVIHQTGDSQEFNDYQRLQELKKTLPDKQQDRYVVEKFIPPAAVGSLLLQSDIVISRSGINTVTELIATGKPALLIPLPHGQKGEQLKNALFLKNLGLAEILLQSEATSQKLEALIAAMLSKLPDYKNSAKDAQKLLHLDAADKIVTTLSYVGTKKSS